jgi:hypothetical protein
MHSSIGYPLLYHASPQLSSYRPKLFSDDWTVFTLLRGHELVPTGDYSGRATSAAGGYRATYACTPAAGAADVDELIEHVARGQPVYRPWRNQSELTDECSCSSRSPRPPSGKLYRQRFFHNQRNTFLNFVA